MSTFTRGFALAAVAVSVASCVTPPAQPPATAERGKYLVEAVLACGLCHVQRGPQGQPLDKGLSGGTVLKEQHYRAVAANITPDMQTGIGKWTDAQLARAIREGVRPDGRIIGPAMPVENFRGLSDSDVQSVVAFLRAQPAVENVVGKSVYEKPLPADYGPPLGPVSAPSPQDKVQYGRYLVGIAYCLECHTPRDKNGKIDTSALGAGGLILPGPWGQSVSRNLTPHETGLRDWTDAQIAAVLRTGVDRNGNRYRPPMPFSWYKKINEPDMAAIVAYLRTLEPRPMGGQ
jgi:mono/diheme cytochrome c family protein